MTILISNIGDPVYHQVHTIFFLPVSKIPGKLCVTPFMVILTSGLIVKIVMMKLVGNDGSDSADNDDDDDWNGDIELCIPGFKCHSRRQIPIFGQQCRPSEAKNRTNCDPK